MNFYLFEVVLAILQNASWTDQAPQNITPNWYPRLKQLCLFFRPLNRLYRPAEAPPIGTFRNTSGSMNLNAKLTCIMFLCDFLICHNAVYAGTMHLPSPWEGMTQRCVHMRLLSHTCGYQAWGVRSHAHPPSQQVKSEGIDGSQFSLKFIWSELPFDPKGISPYGLASTTPRPALMASYGTFANPKPSHGRVKGVIILPKTVWHLIRPKWSILLQNL